MNEAWVAKATLFELLSMGFRFSDQTTAETLASGEYGDAIEEAVVALGLNCDVEAVGSLLAECEGRDARQLLQEVRREYSRLFIGFPEAIVPPYAGIYYAKEVGVQPVLFVNKESMSVERFVLSCGLCRPEGTNEPLDHISTELEFLEYLALDRAGLVNKDEGMVPEGAYEAFYEQRFAGFAKKFAKGILDNSSCSLYRAAAMVLASLPDAAL